MTVTNTVALVTHTGNGSTTVWAYSFYIGEVSEVVVTTEEIATGILETLNASQYTFTPDADFEGGTLTYPKSGTPLPSTYRIHIARATPRTQLLQLTNQGNFNPDLLEDAYDKLTRITQELSEVYDSVTSAASNAARAEAAKDTAVIAAANAVSSSLVARFATVAALLADDNALISYAGDGGTIEVSEGNIIEAGGFRYSVRASGASDNHVVTAGGVKLDVLESEAGGVNVAAFGAIGDGVTDDTTIVQAALDAGFARVILPEGSFLIGAGGLTWPAGVEIVGHGTFLRSGNPTAGCLVAATAGTFRISGVTFNEGGHSQQYGAIETNHASVKLYVSDVFASNGYAGVWAKQAAIIDINGGEYWDTSHNLYFGDNDDANLPATIDRVTVRGAVSRNARSGGDGLKTVSNVKRLSIIGGRYFANAQDGIDLYAGCDEAMLIGVECFGNTINGADIKVGIIANEPYADWGQRRRVAIIGGYYGGNSQTGIKIDGDATNGYFQDMLVQSANIVGNAYYGILCSGTAPRILGNLLVGNGTSDATAFSAIYMLGNSGTQPVGGIIANNVIANNGVAGKVNVGLNIVEWNSLLVSGNIIGNTTDRPEAQEIDWGLAVGSTCSNIHVINNHIGNCNTYKMSIAAGTSILGINPGVAIKTRGTLTITSGNTTATVNHNAAGRPAPFTQVRLYPLSNQRGSGHPYISSTSTTQITAAVSTAPTGGDITVGWEVDLTEETNTYAILA